MRESHALWDALSNGKSIVADTPSKKLALYRYNTALLAERTGWTPEYIRSMDIDEYNAYILIYKIIDFKRNQKES